MTTFEVPTAQASSVQAELLRMHRAGTPYLVGANALMALLLAWVLQPTAAPAWLIAWLAGLLLVLSARLALMAAHRQHPDSGQEGVWLRRYRAGIAAQGLAWGLAAAIPLQPSDPVALAYLAGALTLVIAGALVLAAFDLPSIALFALPCMLPLLARLAFEQASANLVTAVAALLFLGMIMVASRRAQRNLRDNIALRAAEAGRARALQQRDEQLRSAERIALVGSFDWNPQSGELHWSEGHYRLWGQEPGSVDPSYAVFQRGVHPADLPRLELTLQQALAGGRSYDCAHRVVWPDGAVRDIHARGEVMFDEQGRAVRMIGTVQDVSAQRQAEAVLRTFEFVVNSISDMVSVMDENRVYHLVNDAWCRATGLTRAQVIDQAPGELQRQVATEERVRAFNECLQTRQPRSLRAMIDFPGTGARYWETTFYPYIDPHSERRRVVVVTRDVTEQQASQDAVAKGLAQLRLTLNSTGDAIFASDAVSPSEPLLFVNDLMLQMWRIPPEQAADLNPAGVIAAARKLFMNPEREVRNILDIIASGMPHEDQVELTDGRVLARRCIPALHAGRPIRVWVFRDITDLKRTERALLAAKDQAEQANRAKSQFLSSMSHELRTPMNAVLGFAQLIESDREHALSESQRQHVGEILRGGRHLLALINDLIDLARIESGHIGLELEPMPLDPLIQDCLQLVAPLAQTRSIRLSASPLRDPDCHVLADPTRLKQIVLNLLGNAIKYNRADGQVVLTVDDDAAAVRLNVIDTGPGIAGDQRHRLFRAFERLGAESSQVEGAGIGLALSKQLIELMQGRIGVESTPGVGSRFWIELRRALPEAEAGAPVLMPTAPADLAGLPARRVLYIEDNPVNQVLMQAMLQRRPGLELECASLPEEGIDRARAARPDLILLDIHLEGIDGFEVLKRLRADADTGSIPVIAVSANAMSSDIARGRAAGFDDYLTKPLDLVKLHAAVGRLLDRLDRLDATAL